MDSENPTTDNLIRSGNQFVGRFLAILVVVHLVVVVPALDRADERERSFLTQQRVTGLIDNAIRRLEQELEIEQLAPVPMTGQPQSSLVMPTARAAGESRGTVQASRVESVQPSGESSGERESARPWHTVLEQRVRLELNKLDVQDKNRPESFKLPILDIDFNENVILLLYPVFAFVGLTVVLWRRQELLATLRPGIERLPLWCVPISLAASERPQWRSIRSKAVFNFVGLSSHLLLWIVVLEAVLSLARQPGIGYSNRMTAILGVVLLIPATLTFVAIFRCVRTDLKQVRQLNEN